MLGWCSRLSPPAVIWGMLLRAGSTRRQALSVCPWSGTTRGSTPTQALRRFSAKRPMGRSRPEVLDGGPRNTAARSEDAHGLLTRLADTARDRVGWRPVGK